VEARAVVIVTGSAPAVRPPFRGPRQAPAGRRRRLRLAWPARVDGGVRRRRDSDSKPARRWRGSVCEPWACHGAAGRAAVAAGPREACARGATPA